jgi:hypothetical protein
MSTFFTLNIEEGGCALLPLRVAVQAFKAFVITPFKSIMSMVLSEPDKQTP